MTAHIFAAVFAILERGSYEGLSMDAIAAMADVSRPALYRRFSSVGETTLAALTDRGPVILPMPYTMDLRKDLRSYFEALVVSIASDSAVGRALRGALAAALVDAELRPHFARFISARRKPVLDRLIAWNSSYGETELDSTGDALFGPILYRLLIRQVPVNKKQIAQNVDRALREV